MLERESPTFDEISIVFLSDRPMQRLNRLFTGRDLPTDTLAFELAPEVIKGKKVSGIRIGEVIVSVDRASAQARRYRVRLEKELARLLIHGLLHLCGFDDETRSGRERMRKREDLYLSSLEESISGLVVTKRKTIPK